MNKYNLTSKSFNGVVSLIYASGLLVSIDAISGSLNENQLHYLYANIPVNEGDLEAYKGSLKNTTITPVEYTVTLAEFKREYPYSRNMHLLDKIWEKMNQGEQIRAWAGAKAYRRYCNRNAGWYKPKIAAAWLKDKEYLNNWDEM
ncbi:MAG: hypothetical protein QM642_09365 [Edaphocola sp.]